MYELINDTAYRVVRPGRPARGPAPASRGSRRGGAGPGGGGGSGHETNRFGTVRGTRTSGRLHIATSFWLARVQAVSSECIEVSAARAGGCPGAL